jgi:thiol-disulfide isomerase/thioredoxin
MIFITQEDEIRLGKTQCIYFYASWMPFHQKMSLMLSLIEAKRKDIDFFAIDVDEFKNQCKRFNIETIPTIIVLKEGKEVKRLAGVVNTKVFIDIFADICTS